MFGLFKPASVVDPLLGTLRRSRGSWRGTIALGGATPVPLVLKGSRTAPDPEALRLAQGLAAGYATLRPAIAAALRAHAEPYAEVAASDLELPFEDAEAVWPHASIEFVQVSPLDGALTVEIGYRVAWDEEHTLGARFRDGRLVELCGSVLSP